MPELPEGIQSVERLSVTPDEVLLVRSKRPLRREEDEELRVALAGHFEGTGIKALLVGPNFEISVVKTEVVAHA